MTTTETKPETVNDAPLGTVEPIAAGDFVGMLADLLKSAGTDPVLPILTCVRLHTTDGWLHGWTTDRYIGAHARVEVRGALPEPVWLFREALDQLVKIGRKARKVQLTTVTGCAKSQWGGRCVHIDVDGTSLHCEVNVDTSGTRSYQSVFTDELPKTSGAHLYQPKCLALFASIAKRRGATEYVTLVPGETQNRPTHVRIGDNYRAWVMPVRAAAVDSALELDWLPASFDTELPGGQAA
ncbi:hypothetical protein [Labedaea rhizosphaerae]|uniref:Uncharacterized protein n=1 Tax=Labedaea rhizosphaerae TaxID=598644 RepID=A0A4R6SET5_LABRH|nr:hypothetical protein [Labedaea rhizosphaerae]TDP97665.1 hypothetical protein EV186_103629 [Labedaea rhizosphaerae]